MYIMKKERGYNSLYSGEYSCLLTKKKRKRKREVTHKCDPFSDIN